MIAFKQIYIRNFGSFPEATLNYNLSTNVIYGENLVDAGLSANGVGKSQLMQAIRWIIYKSARKNDPSMYHNGDCEGRLIFEIDGDKYIISRYYGHKKHKNKVFLHKNDVDISGKNSSDTEKLIQNLISIPLDIFNMTCVIDQGLPNNFTKLTPTARKEVFEKLIGFDKWDLMRSKVVSYKDSKIKEKNVTDTEIIKLETKINFEKEKKQDLLKEIKANEELLLEKNEELNKLKPEYDKFVEINGNINNYNSSKKNFLANKEKLDQMLLSEICPTCGQRYPEERTIKITEERDFLNSKISRINDLISLEEDQILNYLGADVKYNNAVSQVSNIQYHVNILKLDYNNVTNVESLDNMIKELEILTEKQKELYKEIEHANYINSILLPSSTFRSQVLVKYLDVLNVILAEASSHIMEKLSIKIVPDKNFMGLDVEANIGVLDNEEMSGGESRRLDVIIFFSFQKLLRQLHNIYTNLISFDEIFDSVDQLGVEYILNSFDYFFPPETCIYIITHQVEYKGMFENIILIRKDEEGSKVIIE
jgi:DNA repair exonuclease SbcCD ATPase subunit